MTVALPHDVRLFLDEPRFGVVATVNDDGAPQQSVVWYTLRNDQILFNTKKGRLKDRNLRRDPHLSFCVEDGYRWVAVRGVARIVDDQATALADMLEITRRYKSEAEAQHEYDELYSKQQRVSILLPIDHLTLYGSNQ
jgi:PPOX class probable F420-dependent enzyme